MDKTAIIKRLDELGLPKDQYWILSGAAMVLYDLRPLTHDLDLGCSHKLMDELVGKYPFEVLSDGSRRVTIGTDVEIFEEYCFGTVDYIQGYPLLSLEGLLMMKKQLNREKDQRDIALIEARLSEKC